MSRYRLNSLSATAIQTYFQCKQKYYFQYFSKELPIRDEEPLHFGTAVHHGLEYMGIELMEGKELSKELCERAIEKFISKCVELGISNKTRLNDGREMILNRMNIHNTNYRIIEVEHKFKKIKTDNGTPLSGFADLILEPTPETAIIVDYKTSKVAKTPAELSDDVQLSLYDYMFRKEYPTYQYVWLILDFLRFKPVTTSRTNVERQQFGYFLDELWREMGQLKKADLKPTVNRFCAWCGWKHLCDAYSDVLKKKFVIKSIEAMELDDVIEEWENILSIEKIISERKSELKGRIVKEMDDTEQEELEGSEKIVYSSQKETVNYDINKVLPYIDINAFINF